MQITVLAGGIGGARFLLGARSVAEQGAVTAVVNTGDDITLHGLRICPDLDSVMYTLGDGVDRSRGWGRRDESYVAGAELAAYDDDPDWFTLGDRDLATHLVRTRMLAEGTPLSAVTVRLCERWQPGIRLLPMSDDPVETHVELAGNPAESIHFQEWWVRDHAARAARSFELTGAGRARPAPGVLEAIGAADLVLLAPSNPVVSIGTVLAVPGIRAALRATPAPVVGVSPIIGGAPVRGMADACLAAIGVAVDAGAVGRHYGARAGAGLLDGWLVDTADEGAQVPGVRVSAAPLLMHDVPATAAMVRAAIELAGV